MTLLVGRQEEHPACKKTLTGGCWCGYLSGARCRLAYCPPMPLPLTVFCSSKIQIGFTFLVLAHLGSPGQRAIKRVYVVQIRNPATSSKPWLKNSALKNFNQNYSAANSSKISSHYISIRLQVLTAVIVQASCSFYAN